MMDPNGEKTRRDAMTVEPITKKPAESSDQHASLYEALRAAQETLPDVAKSRTATVKGRSKNGNEFEYTYKYADITDVLSAIRPHFARHGLAIVQPTRIDGNALQVATRIIHDRTGQFEESLYPVAAIGSDHRELGAALTYARRYALCSIIGLAPDEDTDDQTAAASGAAPPPQYRVRNPRTGRMVDPKSAHQQRKNGSWEGFEARIHSFIKANDIAGLEAFWADGDTQAKVDMWNDEWQRRAAEKYEHAQETILNAGKP